MQARVQLVTITGAAIVLLVVLDMVRRRQLLERYALLWLFSAGVLLALAIWSGALTTISHAIGIFYPPNALFFIAIGCIVLLLLHFSSVLSHLSNRSETLAQRQALLEERLRHQERPPSEESAQLELSNGAMIDLIASEQGHHLAHEARRRIDGTS